MNQLLKYLNFLGIVVLAVICAAQWKFNSGLVAALFQLRQQSNERANTIAKQNQTLKENSADLDDFRQRLTLCESQLKQNETDLRKTRQDRDELARSKDQLLAAVVKRDQVLKEQTDVLIKQVQAIRTVQDQRDQAINKFNELVGKNNAVVSSPK